MGLPPTIRSISLLTVSILSVALLGCETTTTEPQNVIDIPKYSKFQIKFKNVIFLTNYYYDGPLRHTDTVWSRPYEYDNSDIFDSTHWSYVDSNESVSYDSYRSIGPGLDYEQTWKRHESVQITRPSDTTISILVKLVWSGSYSPNHSGLGGSYFSGSYTFRSAPLPSSFLLSDPLVISFYGTKVDQGIDSIYYQSSSDQNVGRQSSYTSDTFVERIPQTDSASFILKLYK